ncbi:MAG: S8 family serine peptidase [Planctomycetes bacterium]|nr:S8 family serine peptidase [Planctomycetota bacterium]
MNRILCLVTLLVAVFSARAPVRAQQIAVGGGGGSSCRLVLQAGEFDTRTKANLIDTSDAELMAAEAVVLQLKGPITAKQRSRLKKMGIVLHDYLPEYAYIADVRRVTCRQLADVSFIQWAGVYEREWKVSPDIGARLTAFKTQDRIQLAASGRVRLAVTLLAGKNSAVTKIAIEKTGATVLGSETVGRCTQLLVEAADGRVGALADIVGVQFIEEAPEVTLRNDTTRWIVQSNVNDVTPFYDNGIRGENQIVGVLDGPPDRSHCALDGGKFLFYNAPDGTSFHGTHVSCSVAGNNGVSDNRRGVAYAANMVYNTLPAFTETGITQRLNLHHSQGARIHTNSWGDDGTTSYNGLCRGFDDFLYQNEDDFVCLAVTNGAFLRNPENAKNLLAIGASRDTPLQNQHCSGGSGPTSDGRRKPEVYAPGCGTLSAIPSACSISTSTGTSMASPAVAGAAALVRQYFVDGYYPSGAANIADAIIPSGALIKAALINASVDMTGVAGYPSDREGWGRLLADNAIFFAGDTRNIVVIDDPRNAAGLTTGENGDYAFSVVGSVEQLRVTLVWTDPAASASTGNGIALVNDLDLEVTSPDAQVYRGNFFNAGESAPNGAKDSLNNVEQVHLSLPIIGEWSVRVAGAAINQGTQGYALIVTGAVVSQAPDCNTNGIPDFDDVDGGGSLDCDGDGVPDECQAQDDCNSNGVQDICDIAIGTSDDCSANGVPDECEADCNANGVADSCDIVGATSTDCNGNTFPDECETDCDGNGVPDDCDVNAGGADCNENGLLDACELVGSFGHDCCTSDGSSGCSDAQIESCVCASDPYCCDVIWDGICVFRVEDLQCGVCTLADDCDSNGVPDDCQPDCNQNSINDVCDVADGTSDDCNANVVPDECEASDCNTNGVLDSCELTAGSASDCNGNSVPDECELEVAGSGDCCQLGHGAGCSNPTIEACVCASNPSCCDDTWDNTCIFLVEQLGCGACDGLLDPDCDNSGILDVCEAHDDCNANGVPDVCELPDCNGNGVPDDCESADLIQSQPTSISVCPGVAAEFSVVAPVATAFQWFKDGVALADGGAISGVTTATLSITGVAPINVGSYQCEVFDGCVSRMSDSVDLTIFAEPSIDTQPPASDSACTATTAIISIEASGAQLTYQWRKDGVPLSNGANISGATTPSLTLSNLTVADEADSPGYTCVVTDECGRTVESDASVLEIVGPEFTFQPTDQCVDANQQAVFTATAVSPAGFVQFTQWFKDAVALNEGGNVSGVFTNTLTIDPAQASDEGVYTMRALTLGANCAAFSDPASLTVGVCCPVPGDMDNDGDFDLADMQKFTLCFGQSKTANPACACADVDGVGDTIDLDDWSSFSILIDGP